jgi:hypothetical protein
MRPGSKLKATRLTLPPATEPTSRLMTTTSAMDQQPRRSRAIRAPRLGLADLIASGKGLPPQTRPDEPII